MSVRFGYNSLSVSHLLKDWEMWLELMYVRFSHISLSIRRLLKDQEIWFVLMYVRFSQSIRPCPDAFGPAVSVRPSAQPRWDP